MGSLAKAPFGFAVLVVSLASGCTRASPTAYAAHAAGHGTARIYDATFAEAWNAAHLALAREKNGKVEDHLLDNPTEPFLVTYQPGERPPSDRDQIGVWFLPEGEHRTMVKVVVMTGVEAVPSSIGPDEATVQMDIAKEIARVRTEGQRRVSPVTPTLTGTVVFVGK